MPLVCGFSRCSPVSLRLSFRRCSILASITLIGSQDLAVKSRPNLFTHAPYDINKLRVDYTVNKIFVWELYATVSPEVRLKIISRNEKQWTAPKESIRILPASAVFSVCETAGLDLSYLWETSGLKAVHDKVSTFEIDLRKKPACIYFNGSGGAVLLTDSQCGKRTENLLRWGANPRSSDYRLATLPLSCGAHNSHLRIVSVRIWDGGRRRWRSGTEVGDYSSHAASTDIPRVSAAGVVAALGLAVGGRRRGLAASDSPTRPRRRRDAVTESRRRSLRASDQGELGSIPGRLTPDFRKQESCRTMPLVGMFSRGSPGAAPYSPLTLPSSALNTSLLSAAQISSFTCETDRSIEGIALTIASPGTRRPDLLVGTPAGCSGDLSPTAPLAGSMAPFALLAPPHVLVFEMSSYWSPLCTEGGVSQ
ncbi:hypothetical protein PR048_014634 [Dryococelus australis]|uniref:Uncharacterized protein n=1 Tax=Dryococelus australis TaxID=614101 RepID=A0ABQ9HF07_9NEOP|nr:hypothetical protein PR048_014634 [Dryococelus australis]